MKSTIIFTTVVATLALHAASSSWPQFRGVNGSGVADVQNPPLEFGPATNLIWKAAVPPAPSSPVVAGERIFLTAMADGKLVTICVDGRNGKELWRQRAPAGQLEKVHPFNSPAASTPATDGERLYVYFGSFGLLAYDLDGRELWKLPLAALPNRYGTASSPIVFNSRVFFQRDGDSQDSELLAIDCRNGQVVWRTKRSGFSSSWSTPFIWAHDQKNDLVLNGAKAIVGYDPQTGSERWRVNGNAFGPAGVPVSGDGLLFAHSGGTGDPADRPKPLPWAQFAAQHSGDPNQPLDLKKIPASEGVQLRPEVSKDVPGNYQKVREMFTWFGDRNHDGLLSKEEYQAYVAFGAANASKVTAIQPAHSGDAAPMTVTWTAMRGVSELPSPLFYRGRLWFVRNGGMVTSFEPQTGKKILDRERLDAPGQYIASPVAANGYIYAANESGMITVFRAADTLEVIARNRLGERVLATPVIVDRALIVRTEQNLYAFGRSAPTEGSR